MESLYNAIIEWPILKSSKQNSQHERIDLGCRTEIIHQSFINFFSQLPNHFIILAIMYLFSVLEFIGNHYYCVYDSCDILECHQINEDFDSDSEKKSNSHFEQRDSCLLFRYSLFSCYCAAIFWLIKN